MSVYKSVIVNVIQIFVVFFYIHIPNNIHINEYLSILNVILYLFCSALKFPNIMTWWTNIWIPLIHIWWCLALRGSDATRLPPPPLFFSPPCFVGTPQNVLLKTWTYAERVHFQKCINLEGYLYCGSTGYMFWITTRSKDKL